MLAKLFKTRIATGNPRPHGAVALHSSNEKSPIKRSGIFHGGAGGYRPRVRLLTYWMTTSLVCLIFFP